MRSLSIAKPHEFTAYLNRTTPVKNADLLEEVEHKHCLVEDFFRGHDSCMKGSERKWDCS